MYTVRKVAKATGGELVHGNGEDLIRHIVFDSRAILHPSESVFVALKGQNRDGHEFLAEVFKAGCKAVVVEKTPSKNPSGVDVIKVENALEALHNLADFHRQTFKGRMIAITGSNGKTIIKEWLFELLDRYGLCAKSPLSYNSQLGVPLSLWNLGTWHDYAIIEAGISKRGEMQKLERLIKPKTGIFTNIGLAHQEGFGSIAEKVEEKLNLFTNAKSLIYCRDHEDIHKEIIKRERSFDTVTWGWNEQSDIQILEKKRSNKRNLELKLRYGSEELFFTVPFQTPSFVENALHCIVLMIHNGFSETEINQGLSDLRPVNMRLSLREGIYGTTILDDTYNNDLTGLRAAIDQLAAITEYDKKAVILTDMSQTGMRPEELYKKIADILTTSAISRVVAIGEESKAHSNLFPPNSLFFPTTDAFLKEYKAIDLANHAILIKGGRTFRTEQIVHTLEEKVHGTMLEINLNHVTTNLNYFRSKLKKNVKVMAIIKALAYGSGSVEMARHLLRHGVNYLAVAYADEGAKLREAGIDAPIMVMNPHPETFPMLQRHKLEPEIYSLQQLNDLCNFLNGTQMSIHLKMETGMHRLGFLESEVNELCNILNDNPSIRVAAVFSHLASSENPSEDEFTHRQASRLYAMVVELKKNLAGHNPMVHLLNSGGISRFPMYQFDMVRLGIGLHGYSPFPDDLSYLQPVATFKSFVSQVRTVEPGETVGYGRDSKISRTTEIATIGVGYADGFRRVLSNGKGVVNIKGKLVPVVGNVCMDMTMVDVTGLQVREGDEVIIFGSNPTIRQVANALNTIPYEVLTGISDRVKRVYTYE